MGGTRGWSARRGLLAGARRAVHRRSSRLHLLASVVLLLSAVAISLGVRYQPEWVPPSTFLLLQVVAVFFLRQRMLVVLGVVILALSTWLWFTGAPSMIPGVFVVIGISVVVTLTFGWRRARIGLQGAPGDRMLVDLRDRLSAHGRVPPLPPGWRVDSEIRSAHADAFSGDFMVAVLRGQSLLEIALVDVSGKGQGAGVRSLQLSGAFGGLLGAMPREGFLPAANDYLLDQQWAEGFATAVHVAVDLETGTYWVASAGHPPPLHLHAGAGRIDVVNTVGSPALGVVGDIVCPAQQGRLDPGDVLLLYTDGLVDAPDTDLDRGLDRLMGAADRVLGPRRGGAAAVLAGVAAADDDDRALVLVCRD
ncbi:PP2C family protein-serine/threonine phosphatase [Cellulomonas sp.]|uniref:PP2C family protein-serine/threonine phosphatase n=1 Tax=Cellulomonas sp. TaxID=40001 RepID=UPI001AFEAE28|nr:PP2C family protein-serine/threonine phosphatase [Cellulomonas sp.]MBO9553645.1 serine/threonine-protein phosphatase [Cellulomonas sp.]